jgi:uncharacterized protein (DUF427 family)
MPRATWNGTLLADAPLAVVRVVEGNVYFPPSTVMIEHVRPSVTHSVCGWKGTASYYDVVVGDEVNRDAAWYYPETKEAARDIEGWVAFWHGVTIER